MDWFDIKEVLEKDKLINFVTGARGCGKSFSMTKYFLDNYFNNKKRFVYIRRFKKEFSDIASLFLDIQVHGYYSDLEIKYRNGRFYAGDELIGYAVVLSQQMYKKSVKFLDVGLICFDEFLIKKGSIHYLQDEVTHILELWETIARMDDVPLLFLSNAFSIANPYFNYFNIKKVKSNLYINGENLWLRIDPTKYKKAKLETRMGQALNLSLIHISEPTRP